MEVQYGPNAVDEPNLLYKLQRKIKVFNTNNPLPNRGYNLIASSAKYGVVFTASPEGTLSVYNLKELVDKECEPEYMPVKLPESPTHIAVSCDQELLAVIGVQQLCVYKITDFQSQNVSPSVCIKCDVSSATVVSALQWNPCIPDTIAIAFFDGILLVVQVSNNQVKKAQSKARCICWSPKGKQLVTGNSDGTLSQYKPDLTPAKMIPAPNLFENAPVEALAIYWISTFQFAVVYKNAIDNSRPAVTIINTPKAGQPSCLNYEDICYSMGANRPWYYYLQGLAQWNLILSASSNSMEIATLASGDGSNWAQWSQADEARPELPLTDKKQENYPVGICIDTSAIHQLPWGENETLPFMPQLLVVSQTGLLTVFNIINLNKAAVQVCAPPPLSLALPAAAMMSDIPGQALAPQQAQPPPPVMQPKAQPAQAQPAQPFQLGPSGQPAFAAPSNQSAFTASLPARPPAQQPHQPLQNQFSAATIPQQQQPAQKAPEMKPVAVTSQAQPPPQQTQPSVPKPQPAQAPELNAALKAEQERVNRLKVDQELKGMLVKEVNDFQMELYHFEVKTRELQNKLQRDIDSIDSVLELQTLDTQQLKKACSLEQLRSAVIQLKLELVRACALLADARTHAQAQTLDEWTQADPLTTKRVANIKKLAYYVQTQLDHAHKALDFKWNEINRDAQYRKPGQRMIRPILDDVYQPLVRQQKILARQQGVLRALRGTLQECTPRLPTALLRLQTKDPLSKLTKNILNMSIEPQPKNKENLTAQKLDALRDMLSNHRPVKIKPVHVELRRHLAAMRLNYERSVKEIKEPVQPVMKEPAQAAPIHIPVQTQQQSESSQQQSKLSQPQPLLSQLQPQLSQQQPQMSQQQPQMSQQQPQMSQQQLQMSQQQLQMSQQQSQISQQQPQSQPHLKPRLKAQHPTQTQSFAFAAPQSEATKAPETKPELTSKQMPISVPSFTPVSSSPKPGFGNVARTLFTDEPKPDTPKLQPQPQQPSAKPQNFGFAPTTSAPPVSATTRSILKDMLENKQANAERNDANTFMGQKICSPTAFGLSSGSPTTTQPPLSFTSTPVSDINNMFSKFTPQAFSSEPKSPTSITKPKSEESNEVETSMTIKIPAPKPQEEKPIKNLFAMKSSTPLATSPQNVPDVLKSNSQTFTTIKPEAKPAKSAEKVPEKSKENVLEKPIQSELQTSKLSEEKKDRGLKLKMPAATQSSLFGSAVPAKEANASSESTETSNKADTKEESKTESAAKLSENTKIPKSSATSLFAAANASTPVTKSESFAPSTPTPTSSPTSIFASSPKPVTTESDSTLNKESPATTSATSIFGTAAISQPAFGKITTANSLFTSSTTTSPSIFGTPSGSIFASTTGVTTTQSNSTASSVFGTSTTQSAFGSAEAKPSVFSTGTPASPTSVFGSTTTASTGFVSSAASVFATANASTTSAFSSPSSPQSVFGGAISTTQSVFGTATATTTQSIFGAATPTSPPSLFGTSSSPGVFGAQPATTQASIFGSVATTQASVFGAPATTQSSIFGSASPSTQASVFGSTQTAVFGSSPQPASQTSLFGSPSTTQASIFGSATPTTQASAFGTPPATTTQGGSLFGGGEANLFAAASISTTSASPSSSAGSIFGGGSSGSVFGGSGTTVFGSKPANVFGGGTPFSQKTDAPAQNFWGSGSNSGGTGFGSSGFGQPATTQASTIFGGGATGGSFSSPSSGPFGSPQQQTSVFGTPPPQQTTPGFGSSSVFGSKPAFGQPAGFGATASFGGFNKSPSSGFGSAASFGGGATFGGAPFGSTSPGKMFGGGSPTAAPSFATPTQSNATFESLATQNTLTFGNLAQQTAPAQPAPTFNTSPSFSGWRG